MDYSVFLHLAIVLLLSKLLDILVRKIGLPQVLGSLLAGIIIGVTGLVSDKQELKPFAEIGVVMIMFSAGLETNFKELKRNGAASLLITSLGVIVPLAAGLGVSFMIPGLEFKQRLFFGVILTATSVGITVSVLRELGKLHGKVGATIVTAAVLDDIIGIVILAFTAGQVEPTTWGYKFIELCAGDMSGVSEGVVTLVNVLFFFVIAIAVGVAVHFLFKFLAKRFPHTRRLSIFGLAMAFLFGWGAEELFGVAAITGAFVAGMMMSNMNQSDYVERRVDMSAYMLFGPIFFANIGISLDYGSLVENFNWTVIGFSLVFIVAGLAAKLLGCGVGCLMCRYKFGESVEVGIGMMVRGEVCLIVAQKGVELGLIDGAYMPAVILLVVVSSLITPIILKVAFRKFPQYDDGDMQTPPTPLAREELIASLEGGDSSAAQAPEQNNGDGAQHDGQNG